MLLSLLILQGAGQHRFNSAQLRKCRNCMKRLCSLAIKRTLEIARVDMNVVNFDIKLSSCGYVCQLACVLLSLFRFVYVSVTSLWIWLHQYPCTVTSVDSSVSFVRRIRDSRSSEANCHMGRESVGADVFIVLHNPAEVWAPLSVIWAD